MTRALPLLEILLDENFPESFASSDSGSSFEVAEPLKSPTAEPPAESTRIAAENNDSAAEAFPIETKSKEIEEETSQVKEELSTKENIPSAKPSADEEAALPKKGYNLDFLDKLGDLEHAAPPGLPASKTTQPKSIMKKEVKIEAKGKPETETPADEKATSSSALEQTGEKKVRKPIRPRITLPGGTGAQKKDPFEVEFAFDPNEDPFKPKAKLASSPSRGCIESNPASATKSNFSPEQVNSAC